MARPPSGPIGNSPRDLRDDFIGEAADLARGGAIPTKARGPTKMKNPSNTFHAKVSGGSSTKRADREPHFRRGGFVRGAKIAAKADQDPIKPNEPNAPAGGGVRQK